MTVAMVCYCDGGGDDRVHGHHRHGEDKSADYDRDEFVDRNS